MIAVTFALPQESGKFRSGLERTAFDDGRETIVGSMGQTEITVAHTGMGLAVARKSVRALLATHRFDCLICSGFAGALDPNLQVGDVVVASNYSTAALLQSCRAALADERIFFGPLVSACAPSETTTAKRELAIRTGALAVDMETSAVAKECADAGIPLLALRVISDAAGTPLPVPLTDWFDLRRQRPCPMRLLFYLASHPGSIASFVRFVSALPRLRLLLARSLIASITAINGEKSFLTFQVEEERRRQVT